VEVPEGYQDERTEYSRARSLSAKERQTIANEYGSFHRRFSNTWNFPMTAAHVHLTSSFLSIIMMLLSIASCHQEKQLRIEAENEVQAARESLGPAFQAKPPVPAIPQWPAGIEEGFRVIVFVGRNWSQIATGLMVAAVVFFVLLLVAAFRR
jgi:hypothetical protein